MGLSAMSIRQFARLGAVALLSVSSARVTWTRVSSTFYPYSASMPSSYKYIDLPDTTGRRVDYFFPGLGSFTTNANIYADSDHTVFNERDYLRSLGAYNVHQSGTLKVMGHKLALICGDFRNIIGRWRLEQTTFTAGNLVWHLTASYDPRFRKARPTLLRILSSFQLHPPPTTRTVSRGNGH